MRAVAGTESQVMHLVMRIVVLCGVCLELVACVAVYDGSHVLPSA